MLEHLEIFFNDNDFTFRCSGKESALMLRRKLKESSFRFIGQLSVRKAKPDFVGHAQHRYAVIGKAWSMADKMEAQQFAKEYKKEGE